MKIIFPVAVGVVLIIIAFTSCKQKEKTEDKNFISVLSLIKKQVAHVDTSLYPIIKILTTDSLRSDTVYIPREEFAAVAKDFLEIPDLSDKKVAKKYKEEPALHDKLINRVIITYLPIDPDNSEIKKQELLVTPAPGTEDKVTNIIIVKEISNRDSFLKKNMLWHMDKFFQVITTSQKKGEPESTSVLKVSWNEGKMQ
jgi:hypothetical protein